MKTLFRVMMTIFTLWTIPAAAHDPDCPECDDWYTSLKQPDQPNLPCCGVGDGYYCGDLHVIKGEAYCTIDDDRDNAAMGRPPVPNGTQIHIPANKLGNYPGNPTGHNIVFMSSATDGNGFRPDKVFVYCYVQGGGI